jgi:hypothetical protein
MLGIHSARSRLLEYEYCLLHSIFAPRSSTSTVPEDPTFGTLYTTYRNTPLFPK